MSKHSPTPWYVEEDRNEQPNIYDADGHWVALLPHQCVTSLQEIARANAALILASVNLAPQAIQLLRDTYAQLPSFEDYAIKEIRALLAQWDAATGKEKG